MERYGRHIIAAVAAFALSGASFLFLSCLRDKVPAIDSSSSKKRTPTSSAIKDCSVKRVRKQVRFEEVKDKAKKQRKMKGINNVPENWRSLYNSINKYRSQQATLVMYAQH